MAEIHQLFKNTSKGRKKILKVYANSHFVTQIIIRKIMETEENINYNWMMMEL